MVLVLVDDPVTPRRAQSSAAVSLLDVKCWMEKGSERASR